MNAETHTPPVYGHVIPQTPPPSICEPPKAETANAEALRGFPGWRHVAPGAYRTCDGLWTVRYGPNAIFAKAERRGVHVQRLNAWTLKGCQANVEAQYRRAA